MMLERNSKLTKDEKKQLMIDGKLEPRDKNFKDLYTGKEVFVLAQHGEVYKGVVRMSFENDSYIIALNDDLDDILTKPMIMRKSKFLKDEPVIFEIDKPNHNYIFLDKKAMDLSQYHHIKSHCERLNINIFEYIEKLKALVEEYPEEFL